MKEVVNFYHTGIYFPYVFKRVFAYWIAAVSWMDFPRSQSWMLTSEPDVCELFLAIMCHWHSWCAWASCGAIVYQVSWRYLIINVTRPVLLEFAELADSTIYPPSSIMYCTINSFKNWRFEKNSENPFACPLKSLLHHKFPCPNHRHQAPTWIHWNYHRTAGLNLNAENTSCTHYNMP
jgi:hypothetical protein